MSKTATILNGASLSGPILIPDGADHMSILMPSAWTGTDLTFQACETSDGTYADVHGNDGIEISFVVAVSRWVVVDVHTTAMLSLLWLKIRSGTSSTPVNQDADRELKIILKGRGRTQ